MATRKSPKHREQKPVVAPFDPSAPVHRQQDRDDFIAGEETEAPSRKYLANKATVARIMSAVESKPASKE